MLIGVTKGHSLALETRQKNPIDNFSSFEPATDGMAAAVADFRQNYSSAIHRPTQPTDSYNCHGLTFAARRTGISDPAEVEKVLRDDNYVVVPPQDVYAGDIAIYRSGVEITHSGIVMNVVYGTPWILSKWGKLHEVVHRVHDCEYKHNVTYYRIVK